MGIGHWNLGFKIIMLEHFTNALVLDIEDSGELDKTVYLFTKELGKVKAKAKSARKITSKLSGHLQPLNFVKVRLVEKNGFQITDALVLDRVKVCETALAVLEFIKEMTYELQPDKNLWILIKKTFQNLKNNKKISYRPLIEALGFAPNFALCNVCDSKYVVYFSKTEQVFLCEKCASKVDKNELILME